jgi:large subunit ribosomal protein L4
MKAAALRGALSDRARHGRVHVVASLVDGEAPKTKTALSALTAATGAPASAQLLVVITATDELTRLSLRNAPGVRVIADGQLNTRDVLVSDHVVFTQAALDSFVARSADKGNGVASGAAAAGRPALSGAADQPAEAQPEQEDDQP